MKKLIALVLALICVFVLVGCSTTVTGQGVLLKEGKLESISVTTLPKSYDYTFTGVDAEKIINYISGLNLTAVFPEDPGDYMGMAWVISLKYGDGNILTIYHFGNMFIRTEDGPWYKMSYEEAHQFDILFNELCK